MEFLVHEINQLNMVLEQLSMSCFGSVHFRCLCLVASSSPNNFICKTCNWISV